MDCGQRLVRSSYSQIVSLALVICSVEMPLLLASDMLVYGRGVPGQIDKCMTPSHLRIRQYLVNGAVLGLEDSCANAFSPRATVTEL